jgi:hypothetical protein
METNKMLAKARLRNHVDAFFSFLKAKKEMRELAKFNEKEKVYTRPPDDYCASCSHNLECGDYERQNCPLFSDSIPQNK